MASAAFGAKGDDGRGLNVPDDLLQLGAESRQIRERREPAILEAEEMESHAQPFRCTFCLELASGGQRLTGRDAGVVANPLGAIGGNDEVGLASLPRQTRQ